MTLLTIVNNAAAEMQLSSVSSVVGNTGDQFAVTCLRLVNSLGLRLSRAFPWEALCIESTWSAVATASQGALTTLFGTDFDRIVPETLWDRTDLVLISGPTPRADWNAMQARANSGERKKFIYRGGNLLIYPVLTAGHTMAAEWVSKNWCEDSGGTGQSAFAADTDVGVIDEELLTLGLIYAYLTSEEMPNGGAGVAFKDCFLERTKAERASPGVLSVADIFGGRHFDGQPSGYASNSSII